MPPRAVSTITAELVVAARPAQDLEAVDPGSMRSSTIRSGSGGQRPDRRLAVADGGDAEALALQVAGDDLADHLLVVDYEDVRGSRHRRRGCCGELTGALRVGRRPRLGAALGLRAVLPLKDNVPKHSFPWVTVALIVLNLAVFGWQLLQPDDESSTLQLARAGVSERDQVALEYGAIPYRITHPGTDCGVAFAGTQQVICDGAPRPDGFSRFGHPGRPSRWRRGG